MDYQAKFKSILGQASILEAIADRVVASNRSNTYLLDLSSPITQCFISQATDYDFGGLSVAVNSAQSLHYSKINTSIMKWQDLQGNIIKKRLCVCFRSEGDVKVDPKAVLDIFLEKSLEVDQSLFPPDKEHRQQVVVEIDSDYRALNSNRYLMQADISWSNLTIPIIYYRCSLYKLLGYLLVSHYNSLLLKILLKNSVQHNEES